jgi:Domain of unknown function (DUF4388)
MQQEGSLVQRDFPDLVQDLAEHRWTGVLTLTNAGIGRSVTVQEGRLVFASSSSPDDRLGELLLRRGRISFRQYVDAGKAIVPGKRLGTILVEQGILGPKDLVRAVVDHTQEIIYGAFQWIEGHYRLQDGTSSETITLNISTPDLIMEGIRRIDAWSRITRAVGGIAARYDRPAGFEAVAARMDLTERQLEILSSMGGDERTVEVMCAESTLPDVDVCRALWAFRVIGLVRLLDPPRRPKPEVEDDGLEMVL